MSRYNLPSIPVVDRGNILLGRITFDDVLDVMEAEQTEDLLRLAGTSDEEEIRGSWWEAVQVRLPWLLLNLCTASVGAFVIWHFTEAIEQAAILAVIMPVVAGLGGNAGTQALAVTVRRLALAGGLGQARMAILGKELLVGAVNGAVVGLVASILAALLDANVMLGFVVFMAMVGNQTVAGLAGSFFPTILDHFGIDPAVASSVFVTALTDITGFLFLLGLGSALLL
jgi:magnesium transporter